MRARPLVVMAAVFVCLSGGVLAQDEELPLSNWSALPYWNPSVQPRTEGEPGGMQAHAQGMQAQAEALPSSPLPFVAITPCRIVDTRVALSDGFHQPNFADEEARTFNLPASADCTGLPAAAGAWSLNIQFRPISQLSFLTAYPTGTVMPGVSTMTASPAAWVQNAAIVAAGTGSAIDIYCQYAGRVVIDINGYYASQSVVTSLNTLVGDVTLAEGSNVTITPSGTTLTIAATGGPGGVLPAGSSGQTLYHNGSGWTSSSVLTNDGVNVGVANNLLLPNTGSGGTLGVMELGGSPFLHNYGAAADARNTFVGQQAGNFTMGGSATWNTAIGFGTLFLNTGGRQNTATGALSLFSNTTGSGNTANGIVSLFSNTTGNNNTACGAVSLLFNTTGYNNTATGFASLSANTTGSSNTADGVYSLTSNTVGTDNTASGVGSLSGNTTGSKNTAVGTNALAFGSFDNGGSPWDSFNTAVGFQSLYSNDSSGPPYGMENTALGANSMYSTSTGFQNTATGASSLLHNGPGYANTATGYLAGANNIAGFENTFVGAHTDGALYDLINATAIGYGAIVDASNKVRIGNTNVTVIEGQVDWSFPSDIRHKKDVRDLPFGLDLVLRLRPVEYRLKDGNDRLDMGFVAQDIEALLGDGYNILGIGEDAARMLSLRRGDLIAPLVKAVQEQQDQITAQASTIAIQQEQIEELRQQVQALMEERQKARH